MRPLRRIHWLLFTALFVGFFVFHAAATTYYVDINSPSPTPPYTSWATASTDIQSAVNQTTNGDLVLVNPGVYQSGGYTAPDGTLTAVVVSNSVSLQSVDGASVTSIDGSNAMRGIYLQSTSMLVGFTITNGTAGDNSGGGIYCQSQSQTVSSCVIIGNSSYGAATDDGLSGQGGGGVYSGTLYNCLIISNSAPNGDGGGNQYSILVNCVVIGNEADFGGGVYQCLLTNCWVNSNTASIYGGGSYGDGFGFGGSVNNCLLTGNSASLGGGVMGGSVINCTVADNSGWGVFNVSAVNSIIYDNDENWEDGSYNYCCTTLLPGGTGNITNSPLFVDEAEGNFQLQTNSPCVNAGNNAYVTTSTDLDGNPRIFDGIVDMGAYECQTPVPLTLAVEANSTNVVAGYPLQFQAIIGGWETAISCNFGDGTTTTNQLSVMHSWSASGIYTVIVTVSNVLSQSASANLTINVMATQPVYYVDVNGTNPIAPYSSRNTAATNIQDAVNAADVNVAYEGGIVLVTNGVYQSSGYVAPDGTLSAIVVTNAITLQSVNGALMTFINGSNAMRCIYLGSNSTMAGFTVTNGNSGNNSGGGICCQSQAQVVSNCVAIENSTTGAGSGYGGAGGGGICGGTLYNCLIISNSAPSGQAGGDAYSIMNNCIIVGNQGQYGGGVFQSTVNNCTIVGNTASLVGGGAFFSNITNSIIYDNTDNNWEPAMYGPNCYQDNVGFSCTIPSPGGTGIITNAPLFVNEAGGDFHLQSDSPCINIGNNSGVTATVDYNGNPRIVQGVVDMGSYEYQTPLLLGLYIVANSTNVAAGSPLVFQAVVSQGFASSILWNFDDGTTATNLSLVSHSWASPGVYTVMATVSNNFVSQSTIATLAINVFAPSIVYVNVNGTNPVPPYTTWSTAATDIQDAVNLTASNGIVLVTNGVYQSSGFPFSGVSGLDYYTALVTNAITVQSVNGPAATSIQAPPSSIAGCVYMANGAVLSGFTLTTNGLPNEATCGVFASPTNTIITNCIIIGFSDGGAYSGTFYNCLLTANANRYNSSGGGGATMSTMFNCLVASNSAKFGGGVFGGTLNNCIIVSNTAANGGGIYGGAGSPAVLNNCVISNNTAVAGGGVYGPAQEVFGINGLAYIFTNCILSNCTVTLNSAGEIGGGTFGAVLNNCLISSNQITRSQESFGGGVELGTLYNCTLIGNSSSNLPSGVGGGADGSDGASPPYLPYFKTVLSNCVLIANVSSQGGGANGCTLIQCTLLQNSVSLGSGQAGMVGGGAAYSALDNCLVVSNSDNMHSGVRYAGGAGAYACALTNSVLAYNVAFTNGGGANESFLVNCTVTANTAGSGGGTLNCSNYNTILYYNTNGDYYPSTLPNSLNYCCTALAPTNGFRNITSAPLFVNAAAGNFQLQANSPCIDSGNNAYVNVSTTTDFAGNPRIVGGTVDIGAYEYQTPTSVISYAYLQQYGLPTDGSVDFASLNGTAFNVYQDWIAGLNPTNPGPVLTMLTPMTTNITHGVIVTWQSVSGIPYLLQRSTNLFVQPVFTTIQSNISGQTNTTSYTDTSATNNVPYFYRVGVIAP